MSEDERPRSCREHRERVAQLRTENEAKRAANAQRAIRQAIEDTPLSLLKISIYLASILSSLG